MRDHSPTDLVVANVVAMRSTDVGDYVYRVGQPSAALGCLPGVRVLTVGMLSPHVARVCLGADVLVLHLLSEDDLFPLVEKRLARGLPTVYEISDNFVDPHPGVGIRHWFGDPTNRANAFRLAELADAVQVTGPGLAARFGYVNARTVVLENQLASIGRPPREPGPTVRVGWAGSSGHTEDLREVSAAVIDVCSRFPHVTFAFMGSDAQFADVFAGLPAAKKTYTKPGSLADYYRFLETLDVGIAPMRPNPYNECRSDVKFIEYASRGVVPVLARITPYLAHAVHGENALLFRDAAALAQSLERVVSDVALRRGIAERAYEYVRASRMEADHAQERLELYRELVGNRAEQDDLLEDLPLERACADGNGETYDVKESDAEAAVVEAIQRASEGDTAGAVRLLEKAAAALPGYALPLFWLGRVNEQSRPAEAARYYARAAEVDARSLRALLSLARLQAVADPEAARGTLERALEVEALHAPVIEALASLAERGGDLVRAAEHFRRALTVNQHSSVAAMGLGRLCAASGDAAGAREAFEHAAVLSPCDSWAQHACAEHICSMGDLLSASRYCIKALELDRTNAKALALLQRLIAAIEKSRGM